MRGRTARLVLLALLVPQTAFGWCDPKTDYSVQGEFARSEFVAVVQVTGTTWLDENRKPTRRRAPLMLGNVPGGFDPYAGAIYRARVLRLFKGHPVRSVDIFSQNTSARTPREIGERYLVFLYRVLKNDLVTDEKADNLMIDYCGNSTFLNRAAKELKRVRDLSKIGAG